MDNFDFDPNNRALIEAALEDPNPDNPVARAIAARLNALGNVLTQVTERQGSVPSEISVTKPATFLDEVVIAMFEEILAETPGAPKLRVLEYGKQ